MDGIYACLPLVVGKEVLLGLLHQLDTAFHGLCRLALLAVHLLQEGGLHVGRGEVLLAGLAEKYLPRMKMNDDGSILYYKTGPVMSEHNSTALWCYGAPAIVIDFGTATTFGVIDAERRFLGGLIIPGVKTSLSALSQRASQLPAINIEKPKHLVGRNTLECMQSGILYGTAYIGSD